IATSVFGRVIGSPGKRASSKQMVVKREVRPTSGPGPGSGHMLPATVCQKPVVSAGDQLCAVFEDDSVGALDRGPVVEDLRWYVAPVAPAPHRAIHPVARSHLLEPLGAAVRHEDRCVASLAVG